jgi:hypothetical protein
VTSFGEHTAVDRAHGTGPDHDGSHSDPSALSRVVIRTFA